MAEQKPDIMEVEIYKVLREAERQLGTLMQPLERGEYARRLAITRTELQKVIGFYKTYVVDFQED